MELIWTLDDIRERGGTKLESDVEEAGVGFLVEVADDVGMIVGFLEDGDFAGGEGGEILQEAFDGDGTALEGTLVDDCTVRAKA